MGPVKADSEERCLYNQYQWVWDMIGTIEDYEKLARYIAGRIRKHETLKATSLKQYLYF